MNDGKIVNSEHPDGELETTKIAPGELMRQIRLERREEEQQKIEGSPEQGDVSDTELTKGMGATGYMHETQDTKKFKIKTFQLPLVFSFNFDTPGLEKPWTTGPREKKDDYFNYGFDEESFKIYQQKVNKYAMEDGNLNKLKNDNTFEERVLIDERAKQHQKLNFYLPHEMGGVGEPYYMKHIYGLFNIFTPDMDLA